MFKIEEKQWAPIYLESFVYERNNFYLKYALDKLIAGLALVILLPLFIVFVVAIRLEGIINPRSRGPAIVGDKRISEGKLFNLYKFRTYYPQDDVLHEDKKGTTDFLNNRAVTHVGWFLRKYYLDEIPQLFNILCGSMSFVGPRPVPRNQYESTLKQGFQAKRVLRGGLGGPVQALKGNWKKIGPYPIFDEQLIDSYQTSSAIKIVALDLKISWYSLKKVWDGDGLKDPAK